jgi:hypothetical protein
MFSLRGLPGNPTPQEMDSSHWKENGPFELSNESGRFALLYSIVENHTFHLSPDLARFSSPDVSYLNKNYVSIFAPSISFLSIPGYIIGKHFGIAQFGTYAWMALFALLNVILIRAIAIKLGAEPLAATIAALTFLFASPAFSYAVTLYEHHASTFLILLSFYLLIRFNNVISLFIIWILYAFAFTVDYPNLFMMFPIALVAFFRSGVLKQIEQKVLIHISLPKIFTIFGIIFPLAFFMWFNKMSYDNPLRISGTVDRVVGVNANGSPVFVTGPKAPSITLLQQADVPTGSFFTFFKPRNMLNGLYILFLSPDRGMIVFTPVILFGGLGIYIAFKRKRNYLPILVGIIGINIVLYSMWGDPYGGWAFGARYLVPAYAISAIFIALLLSYWKRNRLFMLFFFITLFYSIVINSVGALTSNSNPPKVEAIALSNASHKVFDYTYQRNFNLLGANVSRSFVFQTYASYYLSAWQYYQYLTVFVLGIFSFLCFYYVLAEKKL